ncbi:hypothetical protein HGG71_05115 [Rhodobacteraceae bacterium R_SAG2]|nr:hypothetical protein [Rhodobacteraceae bacterium R_SAG2]
MMSKKLEAFSKIVALNANADRAEAFWDEYEKRTSQANIDKFRAGFGVDDRNPSFTVRTSFSSYTGSYGSSSVYKFDNFDSELLGKYMVRAMNSLSEDLFGEAARLMREDAAGLLAGARAEVAQMQEALNKVEASTSPKVAAE